jgi:predicted nucleotidyltransferase
MERIAANTDFAALLRNVAAQMTPPNLDPAGSIAEKIPTFELGPLLSQFDTAPFRAQIADLLRDVDLGALFPTLDLTALVPNIELSALIDSEAFASVAGLIKTTNWAEIVGRHGVVDVSTDGELDPEQVNAIAVALILASIAHRLALNCLDKVPNEFIVDASKTPWIVHLMAWQLQQSPQGTLATAAMSFLAGRSASKKSDGSVASTRTKPRDLGALVLRHRSRIVEIAADRGASHVRLFGSVARGEATPASDVDLLVDLDPGVGLVGLAGLEREVSELLGCKVDVVPAANLKPGLSAAVEAEAIAL